VNILGLEALPEYAIFFADGINKDRDVVLVDSVLVAKPVVGVRKDSDAPSAETKVGLVPFCGLFRLVTIVDSKRFLPVVLCHKDKRIER
jgi:hypothetical protein